jgi:hypothetical protein
VFLRKAIWKPVPYRNRADLTNSEITAINHYKDLVNPQYKWDYKPKPNEKSPSIGIDCFIVNRVLRGMIPKSLLSKRDIIRYNSIVRQLNAAIKKSLIGIRIDVIKGVSYFEGLKDYKIGGVATDNGFGSFTTSREKAAEYADINKDKELIFFYLTLEKGDSALYVDPDEDEWILGSGRKYIIRDIVHLKRTEWEMGRQAIVYYLEMIK